MPDEITFKRVHATVLVRTNEYRALRLAAQRDRHELPTLEIVLNYCLKLGIESYLANQPDDAKSNPYT